MKRTSSLACNSFCVQNGPSVPFLSFVYYRPILHFDSAYTSVRDDFVVCAILLFAFVGLLVSNAALILNRN